MLLSECAEQTVVSTPVSAVAILVLCTGNSARSIMAEARFNHLGEPWILAVNAGSHLVGEGNPFAIEQIRTQLNGEGSVYRSKGWEQFAQTHSDEPIDIVLTVCTNAAQEPCLAFLDEALRVHWEFTDPAATFGNADDIHAAFSAKYFEMGTRISLLMELPLGRLSKPQVAKALQALSKRGEQ